MQIKIFLLLVSGAAVVLAQDVEHREDDYHDDEDSLLYDRTDPYDPEDLPSEKPLPPGNDVPSEDELPHIDGEAKNYTVEELRAFYKDIQKHLDHVIANTNFEFVRAYNETQEINNALRRLYLTWENALQTTFKASINTAMAAGRPKAEIQGCINETGEFFLYKYFSEMSYAQDCDQTTTNLAMRTLATAKTSFQDAVKKYVSFENLWKSDIKRCFEQKDKMCVTDGVVLLRRKFKLLAALGNWWAKFMIEVSRKHRIHQDMCYQDFVENLKQYRTDYIYVLKQCVPEANVSESDISEVSLRRSMDLQYVRSAEV